MSLFNSENEEGIRTLPSRSCHRQKKVRALQVHSREMPADLPILAGISIFEIDLSFQLGSHTDLGQMVQAFHTQLQGISIHASMAPRWKDRNVL